MFVSNISHFGHFFLLWWELKDSVNAMTEFIIWGIYIICPVVIMALISAYVFSINDFASSPLFRLANASSIVAMLVFSGLAFIFIDWIAGIVALASVIILCVIAFLAVSWLRNNYSMPRRLKTLAYVFLSLSMLVGLVGGSIVANGFWYFSGSWFLAVISVIAHSYGTKARKTGGNTNLHYSSHIFPVYQVSQCEFSNSELIN